MRIPSKYRITHIGDRPLPYPVSVYASLFGIGWIFAKYGAMDFSLMYGRIVLFLLAIYLIDALIKSVVFIKDSFKLTLTCK